MKNIPNYWSSVTIKTSIWTAMSINLKIIIIRSIGSIEEISSGLAKAGLLISKGLEHFASLLSKRITPSETINYSRLSQKP